jgi:hypothetical protein
MTICGTLVPIEGFGELVDDTRDLDPGHEDTFLPLEQNILRPSNKSRDVALRLDVTSDSVASGPLFEERIRGLL